MTTATEETKKPEEAAASQKSFDAGFEGTAPATTQTPPADEPKPGTEVKAPEPKEEFVQVTKADFAKIMAAVDKTTSHDQQLSKAFGSMGNLQKTLQKLQAETPSGAQVELTDEDFAELKADFPELAAHTRTALERILKKVNLKGTGTPPATEKGTTTEPAPAKSEAQALEEMHPGWVAIVGKADDEANGFRKWLATQPQEYQTLINDTQSAAEIGRAIDRYKGYEEAAKTFAKPEPKTPPKPPAQGAARKDRIESAVQPRGAGAAPAPSQKTSQDHFDEGYASG